MHLEGQDGSFIPLDEDRVGSLHQTFENPRDKQGLLVGDRLVPSGLNCKNSDSKEVDLSSTLTVITCS